jgi:hypothetical protein
MTLELIIGGAAIAAWFAIFGGCLLVTRPRDVQPAAPTQDFGGPEPPAVVSLLANRWEVTEDAAESTLLDLAARRLIEFRQPGNEPMQTTIHVRDADTAALTRYERRVLDRVTGLAAGGVLPLPALTFRDPVQAKSWAKRLRADTWSSTRSPVACTGRSTWSPPCSGSACCCLLRGGYRLARTVLDLAAPLTLTGEVLWTEVWRSTGAGANSPPRPWLYYLAVDDGSDDRTTAWGLPSGLYDSCVVEEGRAGRLVEADVTDDTGKLIATAVGRLPGGERP